LQDGAFGAITQKGASEELFFDIIFYFYTVYMDKIWINAVKKEL